MNAKSTLTNLFLPDDDEKFIADMILKCKNSLMAVIGKEYETFIKYLEENARKKLATDLY